MCGISGFIDRNTSALTKERLKRMTDAIAYRGPDGDGHWLNPKMNLALGHRRLSIIDLHTQADQPMHYMDRYTIVFNGEIYNYIELKDVLQKEGYQFRTSSDTEVLMALYHKHKEKCLSLLDGMFSFAIFDQETGKLFCARDRFGEKPFFYSYQPNDHFVFGSEIKCLFAAGLPKRTNDRMLFNYLTYGFLNNPNDLSETFFHEVVNLPHSHYLIVDTKTCTIEAKVQYYDIAKDKIDYSITLDQAKERFRSLFETSVSRRLRSDVAVGSSLSGGLDSSLIVCTIDKMKTAAGRQNTFSARFPDFKKDEGRFMEMVATRTNVKPHYTFPDEQGLIEHISTICSHQEEPFASASLYAQFAVMKLAKDNDVTVLLDGQGADELLAGYPSYYVQYFTELRKRDPAAYKSEYAAYKLLQSENTTNAMVSGDWKNNLRSYVPNLFSGMRKVHAKYTHIRNASLNKDFFAANYKESFNIRYDYSSLNDVLYNSTFKGGLQNLLRFADRNSMANSREVRLPFLSHELVDFLFTLPAQMKIHNGWTKWIMRETFENVLPKEICWRKDKIGYEPPQKNWLANPEILQMIMENKVHLVRNGIYDKKMLAPANAGRMSWQSLILKDVLR